MNILAFAGSTRTDSLNKKLIKVAVAGRTGSGNHAFKLLRT